MVFSVVEYKIADMGFLRYYLAPKIEETDDWGTNLFCDNIIDWSASDMAKTFIHNSTHQSCNKMLCNFFCLIFVVSVPVPILARVEQLALFDGLLIQTYIWIILRLSYHPFGGFAFLKILRFKRHYMTTVMVPWNWFIIPLQTKFRRVYLF